MATVGGNCYPPSKYSSVLALFDIQLISEYSLWTVNLHLICAFTMPRLAAWLGCKKQFCLSLRVSFTLVINFPPLCYLVRVGVHRDLIHGLEIWFNTWNNVSWQFIYNNLIENIIKHSLSCKHLGGPFLVNVNSRHNVNCGWNWGMGVSLHPAK